MSSQVVYGRKVTTEGITFTSAQCYKGMQTCQINCGRAWMQEIKVLWVVALWARGINLFRVARLITKLENRTQLQEEFAGKYSAGRLLKSCPIQLSIEYTVTWLEQILIMLLLSLQTSEPKLGSTPSLSTH